MLIGHSIWQPGRKGVITRDATGEQWKPIAANFAISVVGFDRSGASCGRTPSVKDRGPLECAVIFRRLQVAGRLGVVRGRSEVKRGDRPGRSPSSGKVGAPGSPKISGDPEALWFDQQRRGGALS